MATTFNASLSMQSSSLRNGFQKMGLVSNHGRTNLSFKLTRSIPARFSVSCEAKKETVDKVCEIVKKQLALKGDRTLVGSTTFAELGADSLDTVEIVMGLEEEFNIHMDEEKAQNIKTVEQAAELIEQLANEA